MQQFLLSRLFNRFTHQMSEQAKRPRLSKEEKKATRKAFAVQRRREKKRSEEYLLHYENLASSDYYFESGLRKVFPYTFVFKAYAKSRWLNRSIYDVLTEEFAHLPYPLILKRCKSGDLKVNDRIINPDYIIKDSDFISHRLHRHELPVLNAPIKIIHEDEDVLVVSKPSSIPVHPCGQYTLNSIIYILAREYGYNALRFVHRLDRLTSGVLVIAKNYDSSLRLATQISDRAVKKYYVCEVDGHFPDKSSCDSATDGESNIVHCQAPLGPLCSKFGLHAVLPESDGGKPARTDFTLLSYNSVHNTSLVLCRLYTGRTHQIRIHLQYLGYPIVRDPLYNSTIWGPNKGKNAEYAGRVKEVVETFSANASSQVYETFDADQDHSDVLKRLEHQLDSSTLEESARQRLLASFDPECPVCCHPRHDPDEIQLILRLHAYRYSGDDWSYTAPLPDWASCEHYSTDFVTKIDACIARLDCK